MFDFVSKLLVDGEFIRAGIFILFLVAEVITSAEFHPTIAIP